MTKIRILKGWFMELLWLDNYERFASGSNWWAKIWDLGRFNRFSKQDFHNVRIFSRRRDILWGLVSINRVCCTIFSWLIASLFFVQHPDIIWPNVYPVCSLFSFVLVFCFLRCIAYLLKLLFAKNQVLLCTHTTLVT